jgi:hypothetical protein
METFTKVLAVLPKLSIGQLNAMIALGAIILAGYAIYVVFSIIKEHHKR